MSMRDWAAEEVKLACKRENPNQDGESFDYGCSCYQSALKAYKSLLEDDHSGFSWNVTKNILIRLMNDMPLTAITEEDFKDVKPVFTNEDSSVTYQCPRMSSLFKDVDVNGNITYSDNDRYYCIDGNGGTYQGGGARNIIDELFPITMPYWPTTKKYVLHTEDFLLDPNNGDFDHKAYFYVVTPDGEKVEVNRFYKEVDNKWVQITKEEYFDDKKKANLESEN